MRKMFSEKQIQKIVNDKIVDGVDSGHIEGNLTVDGDLIAGTITETPEVFNLSFPATLASDAVQVDNYYSKMVVFGNTLRIIVSLKLTNTTESSASIGWSIYGTNFSLSNLSDELKSKIYDYNGDNLKDDNNITAWVLVRGNPISVYNDGGNALSVFGGCALARYKNDNIRITIGFQGSSFTLSAGATAIINAEINLNI